VVLAMSYCLNKDFSTTRLVINEPPEIEWLFKDKFESLLFLPEGVNQQIGGLRTQGYFKESLSDKPLITIITVVFNGEQFLEETVQSVINQTYENVEYIIIDGGSSDSTVDIIHKYEYAIDFWVSEVDEGISDAFNKGIKLASGGYVQLLNCGDSFLDHSSLSNMVAKVNLTPLDVVAFQAKTDTGNLFPIYKDSVSYNSPFSIKCAIQNAGPSHQATLVKLELYKKNGGYKVDYKIRMDFEFFLRVQKVSKMVCYNNPTIYYRTDGISSNLRNRLSFKLEELHAIKSIYPVSYFFLFEFFLSLPPYLIKKFLSGVFYKINRN